MIRQGLRKIWTTWRTEKRLECPFPAPKTWYGRIAGGVFVGTSAVGGCIGGLIGVGYSIRVLSNGAKSAYNSVRNTYNSSPEALERRAERDKERVIQAEQWDAKFNDHKYEYFHKDAPHGVLGVAATVGALMGGKTSQFIFRGSRLAHNFCLHGMLWSLGAFVLGLSTVSAGAAVGNFHAAVCKRAYPDDPKAARIRHQQLILYRIPRFKSLVDT
jgi:hypothetical protein